jgi:hypothetical protein
MTHSKKIMNIVVVSLLMLSTGILMPVKAEVDVTVTTTEDVYVVINSDGSVSLYYNGVELLGEINNLKAGLQSLSSVMTYLATKTDVTALNQTINQLIEELDMIFKDVYSKTNYLASIIGITANSTEVSLNLVNGTHTVASYLEGIVGNLNETNTEIVITYNELLAFENYAENQLNATHLEIESLGNYTDTKLNNLQDEFQALEVSTLQVMNRTYTELGEQREELRQDVLADLQALESRRQDDATQLAITERKLDAVEQRFEEYAREKDAESRNLISVLMVAALVTTLTIVSIAVIKKKNGSTEKA